MVVGCQYDGGEKKKNNRSDFGGLMVVGCQYDGGDGASDSSFSLLLLLCQF